MEDTFIHNNFASVKSCFNNEINSGIRFHGACRKILNRNMYDKLAFFDEVINHDLLAPPTGETSLEQYFEARKNF
ncbi:MAG: hypothetical protein JNM22_11525 [Saprospiraceae bacterium]|nr:hypothetical protein [Saprospiraceae bacterium]